MGLKLAERLGYLYFDSGVMYRAVACAALMRGIDVQDEHAVTCLAEAIQIDVRPPSRQDGRDNDLLIDGQDVTWQIRSPEVDACVSIVAAYPGVRKALTSQQRRIGLRGKVVMVGRDIGTVVLPDAALKIYLDASVEERARRRYKERQGRGEAPDFQEILENLQSRDQLDSTREVAPLKPADDAHVILSDGLSVEEVLEKTLRIREGLSGTLGNSGIARKEK